jgi:hypothetical protein
LLLYLRNHCLIQDYKDLCFPWKLLLFLLSCLGLCSILRVNFVYGMNLVSNLLVLQVDVQVSEPSSLQRLLTCIHTEYTHVYSVFWAKLFFSSLTFHGTFVEPQLIINMKAFFGGILNSIPLIYVCTYITHYLDCHDFVKSSEVGKYKFLNFFLHLFFWVSYIFFFFNLKSFI